VQKINDRVLIYGPDETDDHQYEIVFNYDHNYHADGIAATKEKACYHLLDILSDYYQRLENEIKEIKECEGIVINKFPHDITYRSFIEYEKLRKEFFAEYDDTFEGIWVRSEYHKTFSDAVKDLLEKLQKFANDLRQSFDDIEKFLEKGDK
jgi:hypothetical protein